LKIDDLKISDPCWMARKCEPALRVIVARESDQGRENSVNAMTVRERGLNERQFCEITSEMFAHRENLSLVSPIWRGAHHNG
jgi:hypothetical protein